MYEKILEPHRNVVDELKEYLKVDELKFKSRQEAANSVADFFRKLNPKTQEEYDKFYETCDDYIYENVYCNKENSCVQRTKKIIRILKGQKAKRILEIGVGVGTYSLALENAGFDVTVSESEDLAFKFFKWRIAKRNSKIKFLKKKFEKFDAVIFLDVIEHVNDPFGFIKDMAKYSDRMIFTHGFGIHTEKMGGYPQHFDFKINEIKKCLEDKGFQKQKVKEIFPPHFYKKV